MTPTGDTGRAFEDLSTADRVAAENRELCERTRSFRVPTIILDGGAAPAIFGPVNTEVPVDEDGVPLWEHVSWLTRHGNFAVLKRRAPHTPELESVRRWRNADNSRLPAEEERRAS
jgi:hypothetical protein